MTSIYVNVLNAVYEMLKQGLKDDVREFLKTDRAFPRNLPAVRVYIEGASMDDITTHRDRKTISVIINVFLDDYDYIKGFEHVCKLATKIEGILRSNPNLDGLVYNLELVSFDPSAFVPEKTRYGASISAKYWLIES